VGLVLYAFRCSEGHDVDLFVPMEHRNDEIPCKFVIAQRLDIDYMADVYCGKPSYRVIVAPAIQGETVAGGVVGNSGDGYLFNKKTGLRSKGKR
jgi:hypothetical protein